MKITTVICAVSQGCVEPKKCWVVVLEGMDLVMVREDLWYLRDEH